MIPKFYRFVLMSLPAISGSAQAGVVFSQFYPSNIYNVKYDGGGYNISGANAVSNGVPIGFNSIASKFTLQADAVVTSFDLALSYLPDSSTHNVMIELEGDSATLGVPNGIVLTSGIVTTNVESGSSNSALTSFSPAGGSINLQAGTTYWLVAVPTDPSADLIWNTFSQASTYTVCSFASSQQAGANYGAAYGYDWPAFQVVSGAVVPEPTSIGLFALAGASLLGLRRRRKKATRPVGQS